MDEPIDEIVPAVTWKITEDDHKWAAEEQKRLKRETKHKPTQPELFTRILGAYQASLVGGSTSNIHVPTKVPIALGVGVVDTEALQSFQALQESVAALSAMVTHVEQTLELIAGRGKRGKSKSRVDRAGRVEPEVRQGTRVVGRALGTPPPRKPGPRQTGEDRKEGS